MDSTLELEQNRVIFIQLKNLIIEEEKLNDLMFNQLKDEICITLIYLHSQLEAEKARSIYFKYLLKNKSKINEIVLNSDSFSSNCSENPESPLSSTFDWNEESGSHEQDTHEMLNKSKIPLKIKEKYSAMIQKHQNDIAEMQASIDLITKKNSQYKKTIKQYSKTFEQSEETNEQLKKLNFSLENKIKTQDNELSVLKNKLINKDEIIDNLKISNQLAIEKLILEKNQEISKLEKMIQSLNEKIKNYDKTIEINKAQESKKLNEQIRVSEKLLEEKKNLNEQIQALAFEKKSLIQRNFEFENKIEELDQRHEREKVLLIRKFSSDREDLLLQLKDAKNLSEVNSLTTMESLNNELLELEDSGSLKKTENFLEIISKLELKNSELKNSINQLNLENLNLCNILKEKSVKDAPEKSEIGVQVSEKPQKVPQEPSLKGQKSSFFFRRRPNPIVKLLFN